MTKEKKYVPPKPSAGDAGHAVLKAGLGAIPLVGAPASELLNMIVLPPLERRRNKWAEDIGEALRVLEERKEVSLESLGQSDEFIDVVLEATRIALKTSSQEKKEALKNAILNTALGEVPDESLQSMYLSYVDTLTVWHIKLLDLFSHPPGYIAKHNVASPVGTRTMGTLGHLVEGVFPELDGKRDIYDLIWKDLYSKALVDTDALHVLMSVNGLFAKRTTEIGNLFLDFIRNPIQD
jgi:hypothetical protein